MKFVCISNGVLAAFRLQASSHRLRFEVFAALTCIDMLLGW